MTNQEILQKAIIKSGIVNIEFGQKSFDFIMNCERYCIPEYYFDTKQHYSIIFDKDFAKAFWNSKYIHIDSTDQYGNCLKDWQYHLQQIVLEKEPLKYLEKFLND